MFKFKMLYIIATPIGNLKDITLRALEALKQVDFILAEDTRRTQKLLNHYDIKTPTISYHQHSKLTKTEKIIKLLKDGKNLALVTDAGTPGISDPAGKLIKEITTSYNKLREVPTKSGRASYNKLQQIVPIPGPSALTTAASVSGLPTDSFTFLGFLPTKKGRETLFREIAASKRTIIFYESTHRIEKALNSLKEHCPTRQLVVCRELTKKFESVYRGTPSEVLDALSKDSIKGEFVILIEADKK